MKKVVITLLMAACSAPILADNMYVVGAFGSTSADLRKSEFDSTITAAGVLGLNSSVDDSDFGYKIQFGYQLDPYVAIEGGYVNLGQANYSASYTGGTAKAEFKSSGWNVAAVVRAPIYQGLSAFGKFGTIYANVQSDIVATGSGRSATASPETSEWKPMWGVGASYDINKVVGIRLEYEQFINLGNKNSTGTSDVTLISTGLVLKF